MTNPYTYTHNATEAGVATCNADILNENLEYLKYKTDENELRNYIKSCKVDGDGNAELLEADGSDLTISIDNTDPFVAVYPNGQELTFTDGDVIDLSNEDDGTYSVIIDDDGAVDLGGKYVEARAVEQDKLFYNVDLVGNATISEDGILSGFSTSPSSYALLPKAYDFSSPWEWVFAVKTGAMGSVQNITHSPNDQNKGLVIYIHSNSTLNIYASSNGSTWDIASNLYSTATVSANTEYLFKMSWDGSKYYLDVSSDDGDSYTNYITVNNSSVLKSQSNQALGLAGFLNAYPFLGTFDLKKCYLKIGDKIMWEGASMDSVVYWLDTSKIPNVLKKLEATEWVEKQGVYAGSVTVGNGVITEVKQPVIPKLNQLNNFARTTNGAWIVETYQNGSSWYRIWSDGWCEQGCSKVPSYSTWKTITLLKPYKDTNYQLLTNCNGNVNGSSTWTTNTDGQAYTKNQIQIKGTNADNNWLMSWKTAGYIR